MGRNPNGSLDDERVVESICAQLLEGKGLSEILSADDMPARSTFYVRMAEDEEFRTRIARAKVLQQDAEVDRIVEMADEATASDWQVVKLRIWARQWRASKLAPKKYGDKLDLNHGGQEGNPVETVSRIELVAPDHDNSES